MTTPATATTTTPLIDIRNSSAFSAEENAIIASFTQSIDSMWIFIAGFLVFFMQAGFAMLEVGAVRSKNASNILLKNLFDIAFGSIVWWLVGYGFAYGDSAGGFIGASQFAGTTSSFSDRDWFFQWAFAATAATIVSGALAERTRFLAYALFSVFVTGFIYPIIVHWTWGGGWLNNLHENATAGYTDFAGSGIVHMTGGVCGLIGAAVVGPRSNRFLPSTGGCCKTKTNPEHVKEFIPSNMPFVILGTLILWFGWYGFNCGSTLGFIEGNVNAAGTVAINTSIAAGAAGFAVLAIRALVEKCRESRATYYDVSATANGILAGLVSITAGCADVEDYAAFVIGLVGAIVYVGVSQGMRSAGIDDPLDAFAVHGACGAWGVFALGLFHNSDGVFYGGDGELLGWQMAGILAIGLWSAVMALVVFGVLHVAGFLRVPDREESTGLDTIHHGGNAYTLTGNVEMTSIAKEAAEEEEGVQEVAELSEEPAAAEEQAPLVSEEGAPLASKEEEEEVAIDVTDSHTSKVAAETGATSESV